MTDLELLALLDRTVDAVAGALAALDDWGPAGTRPGQYRSDLVADAAGVDVLVGAGVGVLSEESGLTAGAPEAPVVVIDPVDGSTNASRGLPWFACSVCAVDAGGPAAAVVANLATGARFRARRGAGATLDGRPVRPSGCVRLDEAMVALSGYPSRALGWRQYRALGAAALDLCAVAAGLLDAYVDCGHDAHGPWDYLGALLVCREAGAAMVDAQGRDLVVLEHGPRRTPVAAATPELLDQLLAARS